jgi:hypothetical protein
MQSNAFSARIERRHLSPFRQITSPHSPAAQPAPTNGVRTLPTINTTRLTWVAPLKVAAMVFCSFWAVIAGVVVPTFVIFTYKSRASYITISHLSMSESSYQFPNTRNLVRLSRLLSPSEWCTAQVSLTVHVLVCQQIVDRQRLGEHVSAAMM